MNREFVNDLIMQYKKQMYSFALSKTSSIQEAEELADRIVVELYASLLSANDVSNPNAYMYRIAHNVYARYVNECIRHRHAGIDGVALATEDFTRQLEKDETIQLVKREIAYLGKMHRQIIVKHYYENKKIWQIAKELHLSEGTVKWYLFDARKSIGKGMEKMRETGNLGIHPVKMKGMGHNGTPGEKGDTSYYLATTIRQNIVYATYHQNKTLTELAEELGISPVYLQDEVDELAANGFLTEKAGGKYSSNVVINEVSEHIWQKIWKKQHELADIICREYIAPMKNAVNHYDKKKIYVPQEDENFLLWNIIMYAMQKLQEIITKPDSIKQYEIKTQDGGCYVPLASVETEEETEWTEPFPPEHYHVCGYMTRNISGENGIPLCSLQVGSSFDTREKGYEDNWNSDYFNFYHYLNDNLPKTEAMAEHYKRLYDRGFLWNENGTDEINMVFLYMDAPLESGCFGQPQTEQILKNLIPKISDTLKEKIRQTSEACFELLKNCYPTRMQDYARQNCAWGTIDLVRIVDCALEKGLLQPLTERQKKGVFTLIAVEKDSIHR